MTRVVAIQPALQIGDVEGNLARVTDLVRAAAREHSPDAIFLPEAMTSPNAYDRRMRSVATTSCASVSRRSTSVLKTSGTPSNI